METRRVAHMLSWSKVNKETLWLNEGSLGQ